MADVAYTMNKLSKEVTLTVNMKLTKRFLIRKWIAIHLISLAARVLGCGIEFVDNNEKEL